MSSLPPAAPVSATDALARRQRDAFWIGIALVFVWGANFSIQKHVFDALTPPGFLFARYLIMPVCAVLLLFWRFGWRWPRLTRADMRDLARLGVAGHLLHVGLVTYGIHWSTAFSSSLILACGPVYTLVILRAMRLERLSAAQVTGVAVAMVGVLVFLSDKLLAARWQASAGDLVLLVAASFFSYYTVASKPVIERLGGSAVMAYGVLLGSLPVVLVSAVPALRVDWAALPWSVWLGLFWSVIVSAFIGWMVWGWVNAVRGIARTAPMQYLMPPVAGGVAYLVADEQFTSVKLAGAALTLAGVALAQFSGRTSRR